MTLGPGLEDSLGSSREIQYMRKTRNSHSDLYLHLGWWVVVMIIVSNGDVEIVVRSVEPGSRMT